MTQTRLYYIKNSNNQAEIIQEEINILEKKVQKTIEDNLEIYFDIRFIESEYSPTEDHKYRIDTIGIDKDNIPVIIEYKRSMDSSSIIQGLAYLSCLIDNKPKFKSIVLKKLNKNISENINWSEPKLICIANDFKGYVIDALPRFNNNIELIKYKLYDNILSLTDVKKIVRLKSQPRMKLLNEINYTDCDNNLKNIFKDIKEFILKFNNNIKIKETTTYIAFYENKNLNRQFYFLT